MIELGGNIKLDGFESLEPAKLVVLKKMIGNFVKEFESNNQVSLILRLNGEFNINAEFNLNNDVRKSSISENNLFFAVNKALEGLKKE